MCAAFPISLQLADFASSNIYLQSEKSIEGVKQWLAGQEAHVPWAGVFEVVSSSSQANTSLLPKLSKTLTSLLKSSQVKLLNDQNAAAVLDPEVEVASTSNLKLAFFFLCHITKSPSSWHIRRDCTQALVAAEIRNVLQAADKRAAELLLLTTFLELFVAGPVSDASLKPVAAATKKTVVDFLALRLCQDIYDASRSLEALFSLAEQPKQKDSVLKDIASVFLAVMHRSELAGCSIVAATLDRAGKNSSPSSSENLAFILHTLAVSKDPCARQMRAALMALPQEVCLLLQHSRPAVKKAASDIAAIIGFGNSGNNGALAVSAVEFWYQVAIAAVLNLLHDHDANLRAKALSILENYADAAVAAVAISSEATLDSFSKTLSDSLIDRSVSVRKKAVVALTAVVTCTTRPRPASGNLLSALQAKTLPTVCKLLQLPRDSKLYPGETSAAILCTTFIALAQPSLSPAGALSMLCLYRSTPDITARLQLQTAFAEACLPKITASATLPESFFFEALLSKCTTQQEVEELRSLLHSAAASHRTLAARMQADLSRVAEQLSNKLDSCNDESMERLAKMIYVLGPPASVAHQDSNRDGNQAEEEFAWLLDLTDAIAVQTSSNDPDNALYWFLRSLELWMEQLEADSRRKQANRLPPLVISVAASSSPDATRTAVTLLHALPNARKAFNTVLSYFAHQAGISHYEKKDSTSLVDDDEKKSRASLAFLSTLAAMSDLYKHEKAEFLAYLKQQQSQSHPRGIADETQEEVEEGAPMDHDEVTDFCLQAEGENSAHEDAAQKYLDGLLEAEDTAPAAFVPALLDLSSSQTEAFKVLEALACLSHPLAEKCISLTSLLQPQPEYTKSSAAVTVQAIKFLKSIIQAFPTAYGSLLAAFAPLLSLATADATPNSSAPLSASSNPAADTLNYKSIVSIVAAGSFAELVLSNKIKVYESMGLLGSGLASTIPAVAETSSLVLRQLLAGVTASGDRASFILGIAQQTPLHQRRAATSAALKLLSETDQSSNALVGPCITAALNACQPAAALGSAGQVGMQVVLKMLKMMHPSIKMLKMLHKGLQSSGLTTGAASRDAMPRALRKELEEFVKRASNDADFSSAAEKNGDIINGMNEEGADTIGNGKKRGRPGATAAKATAVKKLQQDILGLLAVKKVDQLRAPTRRI